MHHSPKLLHPVPPIAAFSAPRPGARLLGRVVTRRVRNRTAAGSTGSDGLAPPDRDIGYKVNLGLLGCHQEGDVNTPGGVNLQTRRVYAKLAIW
ncbi:hypothetical protein ES703_121755 [subsurface metagenome]